MIVSEVSQRTLQNIETLAADVGDNVEHLLFEVRMRRSLSPSLNQNMSWLKDLLHNTTDVVFSDFTCQGGRKGALMYDPNFVNYELLVWGILEPLTRLPWSPLDTGEADLDDLAQTITPVGAHKRANNCEAALTSIWSGNVVVLLDGTPGALSLNIGQVTKRGISRPVMEQVVLGPHDGFIEDGETNLSLIRQRLRTPRLVIEKMTLGRETHTTIYLLSLYGITDDELVFEMKRDLQSLHIDSILESNYLVELLKPDRWTPFPTVLRTDRPDRVAAGLLEGRIAIVIDGTPLAIVAPATLSMLMTSASDYYQNWMVASALRTIRYIALLASLFLPALYVAVTTYHQEVIPTPLLVTMAAARTNVPLPSVAEVLLLMVTFDIIREAGARVPSGVGSALTIGGTLVVGDAAVKAGIVSSPIIIVVAGIVIAIYAIPTYELAQAIRFATYPMILAGAVLGLYGIIFVTIALLAHLASLQSMGVPYLAPAAPSRPAAYKDFILRAPWFRQKTRPPTVGYPNPIRQGGGPDR